jgi:hypothetical protein
MSLKFKVGDKIKIVKNSHEGHEYFNQYIGKSATITRLNGCNDDGDACYYTDIPAPSHFISPSNPSLSVCELNIELYNEN